MRTTHRLFALLLAGPLWLAPVQSIARPDLSPIVERLNSRFVRVRVTALRDLTRLPPNRSQVRPILEKLVADPSAEVRTELCWTIKELLGPDGVDLLERLYAHPDGPVRSAAVRAACRMWDHQRPRKLCRAGFADPDYLTRIEVLTVLRDSFARDAEAVAVFRLGLADPLEQVQRAAVFAIQAARDAEAVPELGRLARTASDLVGEPAAGEALATIGTPAAVEQLLSLLPRPRAEVGRPPRPSDRVRGAAARALGRVRDPRTAPKIRELLGDPSPLVRISAMDALMELQDRAAAAAIGAQLKSENPKVRLFALRAIRRIGDPCCADDVRRALREDPAPLVRATAASTLGDLMGQGSIPDLAETSGDPEASVRAESVATLAGLGAPATAALARFLDDPDPRVRGMTIVGLSQIGGREAIPAIGRVAQAAGGGSTELRVTIAEALGLIRHVDAVPTLSRLAVDRAPQVRRAAAIALGRIGGPQADKALQPLLNDPTPAVRSAAQQALQSRSGGR